MLNTLVCECVWWCSGNFTDNPVGTNTALKHPHRVVRVVNTCTVFTKLCIHPTVPFTVTVVACTPRFSSTYHTFCHPFRVGVTSHFLLDSSRPLHRGGARKKMLPFGAKLLLHP